MEPQAIRTVYATSAEVAIDPAEALRYMGAQPGDEAAQTLLEACMEKAQRAFSYRACFARFPKPSCFASSQVWRACRPKDSNRSRLQELPFPFSVSSSAP